MFKEFINNITTKTKEKITTIKEENDKYQELLNTSTTLKNLHPIPNLNLTTRPDKITTIINSCPDINKDKANIISNLIPIAETYLEIIYATEIKTNQEYYLIPTNKYFWIISKNTYGIFNYDNHTIQIIKNNLMSKTVLLNNILFSINGNDKKISTFINLLTNPIIREEIIKEKTAYLCGILPLYQKINALYSGISLDNNHIVIHTKNNNYKYLITAIKNYEILLDNTIIYSSKNNTNNKITNFQNSCYQMNIRITTIDNTITLPILAPNNFNSKYEYNSTIYQENLNFAKEIIEKLKEITFPYK